MVLTGPSPKTMSPNETQRPHRGAHPADDVLFARSEWPRLNTATAELSWLLTRGYAIRSALKLVGDRHALTERQRLAVGRASCSDSQRLARQQRSVAMSDLRGEAVCIDGFNLLITLEAALGGGVLLACRDGALRDMSSVHGSYRAVQETERALAIIGAGLAELAPQSVVWFLDQPISNSGRLAATIRQMAESQGWPWTVEVVFNPDAALAQAEGMVVSSDSAVLDRCGRWANLGRWLVHQQIPDALVVALDDMHPGGAGR
jgi:hypothetical protein